MNEELLGTSTDAVFINPVQNNSKWCIDLRYMSIFTDKHFNTETMTDKIAPKAYRNK